MNLLNDSSNEGYKFAKTMVCYRQSNSKKINIKFETESIKSSLCDLCDYSDGCILVTGDMTVNAGSDTRVAFKKYAPFATCKTGINDINHIYIALPMYNLIKYSDNYSDTSRNLWQLKRDESPVDNADLIIDSNNLNSQSFKYKAIERIFFKEQKVSTGQGHDYTTGCLLDYQ